MSNIEATRRVGGFPIWGRAGDRSRQLFLDDGIREDRKRSSGWLIGPALSRADLQRAQRAQVAVHQVIADGPRQGIDGKGHAHMGCGEGRHLAVAGARAPAEQ